jgi:hypothetical protein
MILSSSDDTEMQSFKNKHNEMQKTIKPIA